jgi:hypothetical protein
VCVFLRKERNERKRKKGLGKKGRCCNIFRLHSTRERGMLKHPPTFGEWKERKKTKEGASGQLQVCR